MPNDQRKKLNDGSWHIPEWISDFQRHAKFSTESLKKLIESEYPNSVSPDFDKLLPFLFPSGVPLNQIVDLDLLDPIRRRKWSNRDFEDPERIEFWLIWRFRADMERRQIVRLHTLQQDFSEFSDDVLGDKISGLLNAIGYALNIGLGPGASLNEGWQLIADALIPFLDVLDAKKPESIKERSTLLKAWWHSATHIFSWNMGGLESQLSDDLRNRLVESASRHIGILRSVLRDTPEDFEDKGVYDFYDKAYYVLLCFAPPWKRLKPLLLAFAGMTKQAVARDLRTWREHDSKDNPPQPYSRVANWIEVAMYPQNLKSEQEKDRYLQNLREEFAEFCLGRLKNTEK